MCVILKKEEEWIQELLRQLQAYPSTFNNHLAEALSIYGKKSAEALVQLIKDTPPKTITSRFLIQEIIASNIV